MFKNLKSLFIVSDETSPQEQQPETTDKSNSSTTVPAQKNVQESTPSDLGHTRPDPSILDKLFKAMEDNDQAGFDYMEFRKALQSMNALPLAEPVKFQSAFATASTMGLTLDKLINSIEFYKKVLLTEKENFAKACKEQYKTNVEGKDEERLLLSKSIEEKSNQIKKLTEEITANQQKMQELSDSIRASDEKIKETTANFENSLGFIINQLNQDSDKLKQYIK